MKLIPTIACLAIILIASIVLSYVAKKQHRTQKRFQILTVISSISLATIAILICLAIPHGLNHTNITIGQLWTGLWNTPVEDKLPEDLTGKIILYYRFECEDCKTIYADLSDTIKNNENIYWVSSRSKQGQSLLEKYPVDDVPSGIYIRYDTFNGSIEYTQKSLIATDENDNVILNEENINRLLYLQSEKR